MSDSDLKDVQTKVISKLSKGYQQRVGIAQAIIHDPDVLILDEPTNGLDPVHTVQIRTLIQRLEHERTVITSTHILSEIEQIAKRVLLIKEGKIIIDAKLADLKYDQEKQKSLSLEEAFLNLVGAGHE